MSNPALALLPMARALAAADPALCSPCGSAPGPSWRGAEYRPPSRRMELLGERAYGMLVGGLLGAPSPHGIVCDPTPDPSDLSHLPHLPRSSRSGVAQVYLDLVLRPGVLGLAGTLFPYSFHQAVSTSIVGPSPRALAVMAYSTLGGTSA